MRKTDIVKREGKGRMKAIVKEMVAAGLCMCMLATMAGCNSGFPGTNTSATATDTSAADTTEGVPSREDISEKATDTEEESRDEDTADASAEDNSNEGASEDPTSSSTDNKNGETKAIGIYDDYADQVIANDDDSFTIYCHHTEELDEESVNVELEDSEDKYTVEVEKFNSLNDAHYYVLYDYDTKNYDYNEFMDELVAVMQKDNEIGNSKMTLINMYSGNETDNLEPGYSDAQKQETNYNDVYGNLYAHQLKSGIQYVKDKINNDNTDRRNVVLILTPNQKLQDDSSGDTEIDYDEFSVNGASVFYVEDKVAEGDCKKYYDDNEHTHSISEIANACGWHKLGEMIAPEYDKDVSSETGDDTEKSSEPCTKIGGNPGDIVQLANVRNLNKLGGQIDSEDSNVINAILDYLKGEDIYIITATKDSDAEINEDAVITITIKIEVDEGYSATVTDDSDETDDKNEKKVSAKYDKDKENVSVTFGDEGNGEKLYADESKSDLGVENFTVTDRNGKEEEIDAVAPSEESGAYTLTFTKELSDGDYTLTFNGTFYDENGTEVALDKKSVSFPVGGIEVTATVECTGDKEITVEFDKDVCNEKGEDISEECFTISNEIKVSGITQGDTQNKWILRTDNILKGGTNYTVSFKNIYTKDSDTPKKATIKSCDVEGKAKVGIDTTTILIIAIAVLVVLIIVLIIVLVVHSKRKKEDERRLEEEKQQRSREARGKVMSGGGRLAGESYMQSSGMQAQSPNGKKCVLVVSAPGQPTMEMPISIDGSVVVGRDGGMSGVAISNETISKQQFALEYDGESFYIQDLEARNRTALNGIPLAHKRRVKNGDTITAGAVQIVIRW